MVHTDLIYAGIGSRKTPADIYSLMMEMGEELAQMGWTLRSGHADGADRAFEIGARHGRGEMEIYLPWHGFNGGRGQDTYIVPRLTPELVQLAERYHPNWGSCSDAAKKLHARNGCQILGLDLKTPCTMVICWTPGGQGGGGTGQALRIAKAYGIPVFDLALEKTLPLLQSFVRNRREAA